MDEDLLIKPDTAENRELEGNVRPRDWVNPRPQGRYNLVVLGAGTAGLVCAAGAAALGAKVALVEKGALGGDCLIAGCVPSKALLRSARAVFDARNASRFGAAGTEWAQTEFGRVMERMRKVRAELSRHDAARRFADELGVDVFLGAGRFTGPDTVEVEGAALRFAKAAICTGARASLPPVPGLAEAGCLTNESVFSLTELPGRLAVIGAGPIGCELAQAFARFDSRVTLLEREARILGREDADAAELIRASLSREGVALELGVELQRVERRGGERVLHLSRGCKAWELVADAVLVGAGRAPNVEGLGLDAALVAWDKNGVRVDDRLRTTNPRIFAAGDVCSRYRFTHTADAQARIVVANALFGARQKNSGLVVPWCTYTDPEVAHVGMYEADAAAAGIAVETLTVPLAAVDRAVLDGESEGFARVHLKCGSDRILGATVVARHAGEMISEFSLAITSGLGLSAIGRTIHPYPTQAEALRKLADLHRRGALTPRVKALLERWFSWRR